MKTYYDEIEDRKKACSSTEEWKEFAEWLINELYQKNANALYMQEAILTTHGEKGLEKLEDLALELEEKYLPAEINMHSFGYKKDKMLPISEEMAFDYYENGREVFLLYPDNTEYLVKTPLQIKNHNGLFGITFNELDRIAKDLELQNKE